MDRRGFIKTTLVAGAAALAAEPASAKPAQVQNPEDFVGVLVDTTRCIGCRACEVACGETHDLLTPDPVNDGALAQEVERLRIEVGDLQTELERVTERLDFTEKLLQAPRSGPTDGSDPAAGDTEPDSGPTA